MLRNLAVILRCVRTPAKGMVASVMPAALVWTRGVLKVEQKVRPEVVGLLVGWR